ncbi:putative actin-like atpase domain-containing protein [Diaporthe ampelina]|uniref:Putative actin-like atpase domain-containing protein n=1 Tax=Diaporthe ampelina TaxID=1214573 RepID=A0A0G2HQF4_9PEZI|nr:putative actin-like atpase domain-containing protein [Diaporthe ampelina]
MEMNETVDRKHRDKQLVVGFDLGTTYRKCEDSIRTVRGWPAPRGQQRDEAKVPSIIQYNKGHVAKWGYEVSGCDENTLEWFKLALVADTDLPPHLRKSTKLKDTKKKMRHLELNATQVMENYMEKVWSHVLGEIKKNLTSEDFESTPIHVVISIPAIWGNHAVKMMKTAAAVSIMGSRHTGLITYELLSEPEAAVQAYAEELQLKLKVGDIVMVTDLGGGTGDVISYQKVGEGDEIHMELKEAAPGDGDLCGAIFVDEAFENLLLRKLPAKYRNLKTRKPNSWRKLLFDEWQTSIKRNFDWKGTDRSWPVTLANVDDSLDVNLHEDQVRDIFEGSVMPKIIGLNERQIEQVRKTHTGKVPRIILPVGGFGRCPYVLQRLREEVERMNVASNTTKNVGNKKQKLTGPKIELLSDTGEMPWAAICKGACQFGMRAQRNNRLVASRSSRVSVGFIQNKPGAAEDGGMYMPDFDCYMIPNAMRWVGDSITSCGKKTTMAMFLACKLEGKGTHSERSMLYAYDGDAPPKRFDGSNPGFREYGLMTITTSKPVEKLPIEDSASGGIRVFNYNLEVEIVGGSVQITATSTAPDDIGKEVGKLVLPKLDTV